MHVFKNYSFFGRKKAVTLIVFLNPIFICPETNVSSILLSLNNEIKGKNIVNMNYESVYFWIIISPS